LTQLIDTRSPVVTIVGHVLLNNMIGNFGKFLLHLMEQLHDAYVAARTSALWCVVVVIRAPLIS
jgi:hypothetical protein